MTPSSEPNQPLGDPSKLAEEWAELAEQSMRAVQAFSEGQAEQQGFSIVDAEGINHAFFSMMTRLASDPSKIVEAQMELWQSNLKLWENTLMRMGGQKVEPLVEAPRGDRRFKDASWNEDLVFDYIKQSYLLTSRWVNRLVGDVDDLDPKEKEKVDFYTRQFLSAVAPSNFVATNPVVLRETVASGGENLLKGLKNLLKDIEDGAGQLKISMTDASAFEVGKNVATTPGKVVFRNELMELIQYAPSSEKVFRRPLLFVPPWINKFYVMDLQPKNSLIKWAVDQGHTLFVVSWRNPQKELSGKDFEDYMREGPLAALDAIEQATGEKEINLLGFCIGGILSVATLAYMAAKGDKRIHSATLLATMVDLKDVGEVSVFIDEDQLQSLERHVAEKGYLEGHHMASMFNMMRENDLIWSFVVNNYLRGKDPLPFDLLYWNSDSTRLPAAMLVTYLRKVYQDNGLMKPGHLVLDGTPIDISAIKVPCYVLATKEDHIAPWISSYPATKALSGPVRFVLGASGHIAGVINPPASKKYGYWTNKKTPADPDDWFEGASYQEGSWWTDWGKWLSRKGGTKVDARQPGDGALEAMEDAPGTYVLERAQS